MDMCQKIRSCGKWFFEDMKWEENKVPVSLFEHCRIMGYDYDQMFDRKMK
jgi:hypothetical protein